MYTCNDTNYIPKILEIRHKTIYKYVIISIVQTVLKCKLEHVRVSFVITLSRTT